MSTSAAQALLDGALGRIAETLPSAQQPAAASASAVPAGTFSITASPAASAAAPAAVADVAAVAATDAAPAASADIAAVSADTSAVAAAAAASANAAAPALRANAAADADAAAGASRAHWRSEIDVFSRAKSTAVSSSAAAATAAAAAVAAGAPAVVGGSGAGCSGSAPCRAGRRSSDASGGGSGGGGAPRMAPAVRRFYAEQDALITALEDAETRVTSRMAGTAAVAAGESAATLRWVSFLVNLSFGCNCGLFALKLAVAIYSSSLAIIASTIDSSLDVLSGAIIWCAARIAARKDVFRFPVGRSRLEPLAIVVFASVLLVSSLFVIVDSATAIATALAASPPALRLNSVAYAALGAVIVVKLVLFLLCRRMRHVSASCAALATDHINDVCTNSVGLVAVVLIGEYAALWWLDPATAIVLSLYICYVWLAMGRIHAIQLTGRAADRTQLTLLTYLALNHDARIVAIDTVRAYYAGLKLVVEIDIVLPPDMSLRDTHDIGETLQRELECLAFVERAYVHVDYEITHRGSDEHARS